MTSVPENSPSHRKIEYQSASRVRSTLRMTRISRFRLSRRIRVVGFRQVCLKHRKVFIMEQVRYTNLELQQHIVAVSGRPSCNAMPCNAMQRHAMQCRVQCKVGCTRDAQDCVSCRGRAPRLHAVALNIEEFSRIISNTLQTMRRRWGARVSEAAVGVLGLG